MYSVWRKTLRLFRQPDREEKCTFGDVYGMFCHFRSGGLVRDFLARGFEWHPNRLYPTLFSRRTFDLLSPRVLGFLKRWH